MRDVPASDACGVYTLGANSVVSAFTVLASRSRRNYSMDSSPKAITEPLPSPAPPVDLRDLTYILKNTESLWHELRGRRIFITGGTGFFGCWLLESFLAANGAFDLGAQAIVLTRSPEQFRERSPHIASRANVE